MPLITANVINVVADPRPTAWRDLMINAAMMTLLVLQNIPTHTLYTRKMSNAMRNVEAELRSALIRRLQQLSIAFHKRSSTGALQAKVLRDVESVDQMSRNLFDGGLNAVFTLVAAIAVTAVRAPKFLPIFLITVPLISALRFFLSEGMQKRNTEFRTQVEGMSAHLIGMINMIPTTRAHALEETEIAKADKRLGHVKDAGFRLDLQNAIFNSAAWTSFNFFNMLCLILGAGLSYAKIIPLTPGDIVMLATYFGLITNAVLQLANMMPVITRGFESVRSIGEVLECPDIELNLGKKAVGDVKGAFSFESVNFSYPGAVSGAIKDFSLQVHPGETIGIVGPSGSGKSTLMGLILGFERPVSGRILIEGCDMNTVDLRTYRKFVGVVAQETLLFQGTLRENVLYGSRHISEERLLRALEDANALEFMEKLSHGLDTEVGERGVILSGGQKQRIAIARALIRDPRILILDEATSALDAASEALVQTALGRLMKGRTTFIVAHRLSTVRNVDRILVLSDGRVVESGPPTELLEREGAYAKLWAMQHG